MRTEFVTISPTPPLHSMEHLEILICATCECCWHLLGGGHGFAKCPIYKLLSTTTLHTCRRGLLVLSVEKSRHNLINFPCNILSPESSTYITSQSLLPLLPTFSSFSCVVTSTLGQTEVSHGITELNSFPSSLEMLQSKFSLRLCSSELERAGVSYCQVSVAVQVRHHRQ